MTLIGPTRASRPWRPSCARPTRPTAGPCDTPSTSTAATRRSSHSATWETNTTPSGSATSSGEPRYRGCISTSSPGGTRLRCTGSIRVSSSTDCSCEPTTCDHISVPAKHGRKPGRNTSGRSCRLGGGDADRSSKRSLQQRSTAITPGSRIAYLMIYYGGLRSGERPNMLTTSRSDDDRRPRNTTALPATRPTYE